MNPGRVLVDQLAYRYPGGQQALRGITFSVEPGSRLAVLGPNGAGKSTLLLLLAGLMPPAAGRLEVDGIPVEPGNHTEVRRRLGLVFQDPNDQLFCPTLAEDVAFGPRCAGLDAAAIEHRTRVSLSAVGLWEHRARSSFHLSMGEKKRAAIATVLAMDPGILVLDEPSSSLDPRARREMMTLLDSLAATMLIVTHDLDLASTLCSHAVILDGGQLVASGETRALLSNESLLLARGLK